MSQGLTSRIYLVIFCCLWSLLCVAQRPQGGKLLGSWPAGSAYPKSLTTNDAGQVQGYRGFQMQSNSFGEGIQPSDSRTFAQAPDTVFLCFNDQFEINHRAGSEDLSGDPDPSTPAAVGFGYYVCTPTVTGPTIMDVRDDPCVADDGIEPVGAPLFDSLILSIGANYASGGYDIVVANDEAGGLTFSELYNGDGDPDPIVFDLVPITADGVFAATFEAFWEQIPGNTTTPAGSCVDAAVDFSTTIAFLNPLEVSTTQATYATCAGAARIEGGAPELRGNNGYTVVVENTLTGERAQLTTPLNSIGHNDVVEWEVPSAGQYRVIVTDDISCEASVQIVDHADGCTVDDLKIILPTATALPASDVCFPVTAENFTDILSFDYTVTFDDQVLQYTGIASENPALTEAIDFNGPPSSGGTLPNGLVRFIYDGSFTGSATVPADETLFEICFTVIGPLGSQSPLSIDTDRAVDYSRAGAVDLPLLFCDGLISITDQDFPVTATPEDETCTGTLDGSITATASGATGPYTFSIQRTSDPADPGFQDDRTVNGSPASTTFSGLAAGRYDIRVVASDGSQSLITAQVDLELDLAANIGVNQPPTCFNGMDGEVVAVVIANFTTVADPVSEGYSFSWAGFPSVNGPVLTGIGAGRYEVTVTAPNGVCTSIGIENLPGPPELVLRPENTADAVVAATCSGAPDGSITVSATGGVGPYDFLWPEGIPDELGATMARRDGLLPGIYSVTLVDANGCQSQEEYAVNAEKTLGINETVFNISCFGEMDGRIEVNGTATGAAPVGSYFVRLRDEATGTEGAEMEITDNSTPFEFTGLAAGAYTVILRDEDPAGCSTEDTYTITEPDELVIDDEPVSIRDETCTVGMDGMIEIGVTGGTLPYTFEVLNDSLMDFTDTIVDGPMIDGLSADTNYVFQITDANGCVASLPFQILAPASAQIAPIAPVNVSCPGDTDAAITAVLTPPRNETITGIQWFRLNPDTTINATLPVTTPTITGLGVGLYAIEVTTSNDCVSNALAVVTSPGQVTLGNLVLTSPTCPEETDGSIELIPTGGTPNADGTYNYQFSTNPGVTTTSGIIGELAAGSYSVTITDANNCQPPFTETFELEDPPAIIGDFNITPVSCPDDAVMDGAATFSAGFSDGATGSFTFTWSTGDVFTGVQSSTVTNQPRGEISVTVTDGTCTMMFTDTIGSPDEFVLTPNIEAVSCNGNDDGAITLDVTGGTGDYTFAWSISTDTSNRIEDLPAGTGYQVIVTDENGCSPEPFLFDIPEPDVLQLGIDSAFTSPTVTCAGDTDGMIAVFVTSANNNEFGETPYVWSDGVAGADSPRATDLSPGTYSVTITDLEGCSDSLTYTIGEPDSIRFAVLPIEEPACFGEVTEILIDTAFGGSNTAPDEYTFSVNNDGFRVQVDQPGLAFAGDISVSVFDANGCSSEESFFVNQPQEIIINLEDEITIELGDTMTRLNPIVTPAGDVYEYVWTPNEFLSDDSIRNPIIRPFDDILYRLAVTNGNDCLAFDEVFVNVDANRNVYIPNAFSPNRDGRNEDMRVFACQGVQSVNAVRVYDRWGGLMFEADDLPPNCLDGIVLWDGTGPNGKPVNSGVFVYVVEVSFLDNITLTYRGDVTVIR